MAATYDRAAAERLKALGNTSFNEHRFDEAVDFYSKAIEADPTNAVYWANRAMCHIRMENYGSALEDASKSIEIDPSYVKGHYRRATANFALLHYKAAYEDFRQLVKLSPKDKDARLKMNECKQAAIAQEFAKAIESEKSKPPSETVDFKYMEVDDLYDGPRLGDEITLEFVQAMIEHFRKQKRLHKRYVYEILLRVLKVLNALPSLIEVPVPKATEFTVCGDVHGQFYDLLNIFELNGMPSDSNPYLFNGDFVDRGSFSYEVILTLFAFKLLYPNHFHLLRGNHETRNMNQVYGFQGEVAAKVDGNVFDLFSEVFNYLPLACCLGEKVLVVHGGLFSEDGVKLEDIKKIDRNRQPPDQGLMCEILWSDPQRAPGRAPSKRGVGLAFGPDVTDRFLKDNNLNMVVRSHEVKAEGYEVEADGKLVTVFSAPNYCDQMGNKGAFIRFNSDLKPTYRSFTHVPHPEVRPMQYASNHMFM